MVHAGGRPEEYREEYVQAVLDYLKTCSGSNQKLPKRADLCLLFNCNQETLIEWGKRHPEFSEVLIRVDNSQEVQLIDDGFYGGKEINPQIAKLILSAKHNYREKSDVTTNDKDLPSITDEQLKRIIKG